MTCYWQKRKSWSGALRRSLVRFAQRITDSPHGRPHTVLR
jgi:hypothetical protein